MMAASMDRTGPPAAAPGSRSPGGSRAAPFASPACRRALARPPAPAQAPDRWARGPSRSLRSPLQSTSSQGRPEVLACQPQSRVSRIQGYRQGAGDLWHGLAVDVMHDQERPPIQIEGIECFEDELLLL